MQAALQKYPQLDSVREVFLDGKTCPKVEGLDNCTELRVLSLCNVGLLSLDGFPQLPHLAQLHLADNRLSDGCLNSLKGKVPSMQVLDISNNPKLKDWNNLCSSLKELNSKLRVLRLHQCPIASRENYRKDLFKLLPTLCEIDSIDKDGNEIESDQDDEEEEEEDDDDDEEEEEEDGDDVESRETGEEDEGFLDDDEEDDSDSEPGLSYLVDNELDDDDDNEDDDFTDEEEEESDDDISQSDEEQQESKAPEEPLSKRSKR